MKRIYLRPEDELIKKLNQIEYTNKMNLFFHNVRNNKLLKILGLATLVGLSYYSMPRHIPGLEKAYNNFCQTIRHAPEIISENLRNSEEDYEIPSINGLDNSYLSEKERKSLEKFFDKIKPITE